MGGSGSSVARMERWVGVAHTAFVLAGVFASDQLGVLSGRGYAEGMTMSSQVSVQLTGIAATVAFTAITTFVLLKVLDLTLGLRVTTDQETEGLDLTQHDERGYDL